MSRPPLRSVLRRLSRRDLMKLAPLAAVGAGAVGLATIGSKAHATEHHTGTCRFCLMHCGIIATVQGDRLLKVEGDLTSRTRGFVCEHGYALREMMHSHERIRAPLVRRGENFHEVSWAEALSEIATKLNAVKAKWGPEAFAIQTGWPLVRHPLVNWLHRLARAFGSPNVASVASLCEASLRMGQALTVGTKYAADLRGAHTLVIWGANPPVTAPPFAHLVANKANKGALIVIDPVRTTLAKEATEHVSVRPGTDGALALGLINLIISEGWHDADFVAKHTVGFEELKALAAKYPPDEVERITSVGTAQLARVARLMATKKPLGIWQGLGVEHHESGVQTVRAISSLEVLCGRFDGTHNPKSEVTPIGPAYTREMLPALYRMRTPEPVPPTPKAQAIGRTQYPLYEMYNREAQGQSYAEAILEDRPYPVRAMMFVASNGLITSAGAQRMQQAAEKLELLVTVDPFLTFTAQRSDVVLPACTFGESPDVNDDDAVSASGMVPAQHESWPDWKILVELARAMGLGEYFPWQSFHEASTAKHVEWMLDEASQPRPEPTSDAPRFGTVTGQAEFSSTLLQRVGHEPLPVWTAPTRELTAEFPLRLVTGPRPRAYINSQFHGVPSIEARMRHAEALLHPSVAERLNINNGQRVAVVSPVGRVEVVAVVTLDVHRDAVVLAAGFTDANVNLLIDGEHRDPISGFPSFRSGVCRVERVT